MVAREELVKELKQLNEEDVQRVANFVSFLKSTTRMRGVARFDEASLKILYSEASEEDRILAQEGMAEYSSCLKREDKQ